jgi:hypothetical protein
MLADTSNVIARGTAAIGSMTNASPATSTGENPRPEYLRMYAATSNPTVTRTERTVGIHETGGCDNASLE